MTPAHHHAAWGYASDEERAQVVSAWLADGLASGYRTLYVGEGPEAALVDELAAVPGLAERIAAGDLAVATVGSVDDLGAPTDVEGQLRTYATAVDQARADGHAGLWVAADITPLVVDPERRHAHLRWEQAADRFMVDHPLAGLCLHDTRRVADLAAIACVHPRSGPDDTGFRVTGTGARSAALRGQVDGFGAADLRAVLRSLPDTEALDLTDLTFLDGRAAAALATEVGALRAGGAAPALRGATPTVRRVWDLTGLDPALLSG